MTTNAFARMWNENMDGCLALEFLLTRADFMKRMLCTGQENSNAATPFLLRGMSINYTGAMGMLVHGELERA